MLEDIVRVRPLDGYRLEIEFEDGVVGVVDVNERVKLTGVFAPLGSRDEFVRVTVNRELGTVCWPCGADLDPDVLYECVTGIADEVEPLPASADTARERG